MVNIEGLSNTYKNKKILVTGDSGFKGSWLVIFLLELGANVVGYSLNPKNENDNYVICGLENKYKHVTGDIRDYDKFSQFINSEKPEIIFHLAAQALVLDSYKNPLDTFSTNIMGTINLFEIVRKNTFVKALINVTSDKCYLNNEWVYAYREIDPLGGKDPYSASKAASEIITSSYISSFFSNSSTLVASVRAGNVIGGGDYSENRLVPDCIKAINENTTIIIRNPNSVRPWQYVLEPLYGYLLLGEKLYNQDSFFSGSWNFGPSNKNFITVKELVEKIIKYSNKGSFEILSNENSPKEAKFLQLDTSKANNYLGWNAIFTIDEVIETTINDYNICGENSSDVFNQRIQTIKNYFNRQNKNA